MVCSEYENLATVMVRRNRSKKKRRSNKQVVRRGRGGVEGQRKRRKRTTPAANQRPRARRWPPLPRLPLHSSKST